MADIAQRQAHPGSAAARASQHDQTLLPSRAIPLVYCSGLGDGRQYNSGLGAAMSLRAGLPSLRLCGVSYSRSAAAVPDALLDAQWVHPPWRSLDHSSLASLVRARLSVPYCYWLSGLDSEARWLAEYIGPHPAILAPHIEAYVMLAAPGRALAIELGLHRPANVSACEDDWELNAFCRQHGWPVWVKRVGAHGRLVAQWRDLRDARAALAIHLTPDMLHLEAHITGSAESVVYAAHDGVLLCACHIDKSDANGHDLLFTGHVLPLAQVDQRLATALATTLRRLSWTGGGELELIRDNDDRLWLVGAHPTLPSWIYGVTIAGFNLPALLVGARTGLRPRASSGQSKAFARAVMETPLMTETSAQAFTTKRTRNVSPKSSVAERPRESQVRRDLPAASAASTPLIRLLPGLTRRWCHIAHEIGRIASASQEPFHAAVAYSVKTDPSMPLLHAARERHFLAEVISAEEITHALNSGFRQHDLILNGPAKAWPRDLQPFAPHSIFAESACELRTLLDAVSLQLLKPRFLGIRLGPTGMHSRFGSSLSSEQANSEIAGVLRQMPPTIHLGLHLHFPASDIGHAAWFRELSAALVLGATLERACARPVVGLDIGGGWFPDDFDHILLPQLAVLSRQFRTVFPLLQLLLLEPGKALCQPHMAIETSALAIRRSHTGRELVVDTSVADLPRAPFYPHRVYVWTRRQWVELGRGADCVTGRTCMESDIIRSDVELNDHVSVGSRLLITDSGGYDRSMSFSFGRAALANTGLS
jgi:diaminopimelate decarboxylase